MSFEALQVESSVAPKEPKTFRVSAKEDFNVMHPFAYLLEKLTRYSNSLPYSIGLSEIAMRTATRGNIPQSKTSVFRREKAGPVHAKSKPKRRNVSLCNW